MAHRASRKAQRCVVATEDRTFERQKGARKNARERKRQGIFPCELTIQFVVLFMLLLLVDSNTNHWMYVAPLSPSVQLGDQPNDDHVVGRSRQGVQAENVDREHGADHVHGPVDEGVPDGLGAYETAQNDTPRARARRKALSLTRPASARNNELQAVDTRTRFGSGLATSVQACMRVKGRRTCSDMVGLRKKREERKTKNLSEAHKTGTVNLRDS